MIFLKNLGIKSWIDWVKIIVAIDIASVGVGLIIGLNFHVVANILGFISRIAFGVMYLFVAVLILKRVFPSALHVDAENKIEEENIDLDIVKGVKHGKKLGKKFAEKVENVSEKVINHVDKKLDRAEEFFKTKKEEAKKEVNDLLDK